MRRGVERTAKSHESGYGSKSQIIILMPGTAGWRRRADVGARSRERIVRAVRIFDKSIVRL
jgi:hypothetical protein